MHALCNVLIIGAHRTRRIPHSLLTLRGPCARIAMITRLSRLIAIACLDRLNRRATIQRDVVIACSRCCRRTLLVQGRRKSALAVASCMSLVCSCI